MFQLSITATLTSRYYHIRLSKIPKKIPCIPQLIMMPLYEFREKILLHQEVMIFERSIIHSNDRDCASCYNKTEPLDVYTRRLVKR